MELYNTYINFDNNDYTIIRKALDTFPDNKTKNILLLLKHVSINDLDFDSLKRKKKIFFFCSTINRRV